MEDREILLILFYFISLKVRNYLFDILSFLCIVISKKFNETLIL